MKTTTKTFTALITVTVDERNAGIVTALELDKRVQAYLEEDETDVFLSVTVDSLPGDWLRVPSADMGPLVNIAETAKAIHAGLREDA